MLFPESGQKLMLGSEVVDRKEPNVGNEARQSDLTANVTAIIEIVSNHLSFEFQYSVMRR